MFDYVIVGAGSAGCILANKLSENPSNQVCLLESGPEDSSPLIRIPMGVASLMKSKKYNWLFESTASPYQNNRQIFCPRGKGIGGRSSVNAMLYVRGNAWDYDYWAELGNDGWSYNEVLPYFKAYENQERGEDKYHGVGGGLNVADGRSNHPFAKIFIDAAQQAGHIINYDFNGEKQDGVGFFQATQKNGERCSSANAFLHPIRQRPNLTVITGAHATHILLEGNIATGVEYLSNKKTFRVIAKKEVILSGGAFNSPQLLLLSGIGPVDELNRHKIPVKHELEGVGQNLQEHVDIHIVTKTYGPPAVSIRPKGLLQQSKELIRYIRERKGQMTSCVTESGGFIKSTPHQSVPDLQLQFIAGAVDDHGRNIRMLLKYGYTTMVSLLRPKSRGSITLKSNNPLDNPEIQLNLLAEQEDVDSLLAGIKLARDVLAQPAFDPLRREEILPGNHVQSNDALVKYLREKSEHNYHPVGTCKMGNDEMSVVNSRLKVHGINNLRVADASIMPSLIGGNTNAPTIMIGAKAADLILEDNPT